jgi:hypothetical protein
MANLKNITDLPVVESAEGLNLIVNDNGSAKQIAASAVGAQADWAETDETSPAFVKNKPVEEWDLDVNITVSWSADDSAMVHSYTVNSGNFESCKNKIINGIQPKTKIVWYEQAGNSTDAPSAYVIPQARINLIPAEAMDEGSPEMVMFYLLGVNYEMGLLLLPDNSTIDMA